MDPLIVVGVILITVSALGRFVWRFESGDLDRAWREEVRQRLADRNRELELLAWNRRPHARDAIERVMKTADEARPK